MELADAIRGRRSTRAFLDKPIEEPLVRKLLDFAAMAPSATNRRGWHFIVVNDASLREEMVRRGGSRIISKAPCGILVAYGTLSLNVNYRDDIQSSAAAVQNILLTAHEQGLGSCWICHLPPPGDLARMFGIPAGYRAVAYVALGYPVQDMKPERLERSAEGMVWINKAQIEPVGMPTCVKYLFLRALVRIYYLAPRPLRALLEPAVNGRFTRKFD